MYGCQCVSRTLPLSQGFHSFSYHSPRSNDPYLNRFIQPDSIVPDAGNPQSWNRYTYVGNNPISLSDPTGHMETGACGYGGQDCSGTKGVTIFEKSDETEDSPKPRAPINDEKDRNNSGKPSKDRDKNYEDKNPILPTDTPTPPPPTTMRTVDKYGMGIAVALTDLFIVIPIEAAMLYVTFGATVACGSGVVLGCLADIALADFGISLTVYAAESISSGQKGEFEWIIIPSIVDIFKRDEEGVTNE